MKKMFTIGYEGASLEQLIRALLAADVEVLADVRELPLSRKKGLSKKALAAALTEVGIAYKHYKLLGDPKAGREAAKAGHTERFKEIYNKRLREPESQVAFADLLSLAAKRLTCMMCFERDWTGCHRSILADDAGVHGFRVYHLNSDVPNEYSKHGSVVTRHNPDKGLSAAE